MIDTEPCECVRMLWTDTGIVCGAAAIGTLLGCIASPLLGCMAALLLVFAWLTR